MSAVSLAALLVGAAGVGLACWARGRPEREARLQAGLLLALLAGVTLPLFMSGRTLVFRDALPIGAAGIEVLRGSLAELCLPHWNPHQYAGVPFLAIPLNQVLYPPRLAAALLGADPASAYELVAVFQLSLLGLGAWVLARVLELRPAACLAVAATCVMAGPTLSTLENVLARSAWLPLGVAALLSYRETPSRRRLVLAAACLAAACYGGSLQNLVWLALLAAGLWAWPKPDEERPLAARGLAFAALGILSLCLAAGSVLPTLGLLRETTRAELPYAQVVTWSYHPARLVELLIPFPFDLPYPSRSSYLGPAFAPQERELWIHSATLGAVPLLCGLRACGPLPSARLRRARRLGLGFVGVGLLLALGRHTPLYSLISATPYRVFRYPEKHLALFALGGALLSGVGLEAFSLRPRGERPSWAWLALPALTLASLVPLGLWTSRLAVEQGCEAPPLLGQGAAVALAQLAALASLALPWRSSSRRAAALAVVLVLSGLPLARRLVFDGRAELASLQPPVAQRLRAQGPFGPRVYTTTLPFGQLPLAELNPGEARTALNLATLRGNSACLYRLEASHGVLGITPRRWQRMQESCPTLLGRAANPYVLAPRERRGEGEPLDLGLGIGLFQVPARPRLELLTNVHWAPDEDSALERLAEAPLAEVVAVGAGPSATGPARPVGEVLSAARPRPERIVLRVRAEQPGLLVVRDALFSGWTARVDGGEVPLLLVDGAFMGVRLEAPGEHQVELRYETPGLRLGLGIAALSALLALALCVPGTSGSGASSADPRR